MCAYHWLVCWCGRSQQVGLLFQSTSVALNIAISAEQDSRVSTVEIFKVALPKQVRVSVCWNQINWRKPDSQRSESSGAVCTQTLFEVTSHSSTLSLFFNCEVKPQVLGWLSHMWAMHTSKSQTGSLKQSLHPILVYNQQGFGTVLPLVLIDWMKARVY